MKRLDRALAIGKPLTAFCGCSLFLNLSVNSAPVAYNGHYYEVFPLPAGVVEMPWVDANAAANALTYLGLQGHLVTITDAAEDAFVRDLAWREIMGEVWAGGFQQYQDPAIPADPEAGWTWVNGEGSFAGNNSGPGYAAWSSLHGTVTHPAQPDDYHGNASEQYLGLNLWGPTDGWNDEGIVGLVKGYVVEYESRGVPDSGSTALLAGLALLGSAVAGRRRPAK